MKLITLAFNTIQFSNDPLLLEQLSDLMYSKFPCNPSTHLVVFSGGVTVGMTVGIADGSEVGVLLGVDVGK